MKPAPRPPMQVGRPICLEHRLPGDCPRCARADALSAWLIALPCALVATFLLYTLIFSLLHIT